MLDLVSSDPDARFWKQLREEAAGVFKSADNWIDSASLQNSHLQTAPSARPFVRIPY